MSIIMATQILHLFYIVAFRMIKDECYINFRKTSLEINLQLDFKFAVLTQIKTKAVHWKPP